MMDIDWESNQKLKYKHNIHEILKKLIGKKLELWQHAILEGVSEKLV